MSNYDDLASTAAFLAGRDAARTMRDGVHVTADDAETWCARGMHADDSAAWLRGWRSSVDVSESEPFRTGDRVQYVGLTGRADGPHGRVIRVMKSGVKVRWDSGQLDAVHPEDIVRE